MSDPFICGSTVVSLTVQKLVDWFTSNGAHRLRLPPIQRSLVWRNDQIVNYWDSLLRGYPGGTMMVVQVGEGTESRDKENKTDNSARGEYHLLDGQQRLFAILLGLGQGPLTKTRHLWVDPAKPAGELVLGLRVNSTGNPFGYKADEPNAKPAVLERRKALEAWKASETSRKSKDIFECLQSRTEGTLIGEKRVLSLGWLLRQVASGESTGLSSEQESWLKHVLVAQLTVCLCPPAVLGKEDYRRFFARIGQGGTRLTDDELVYSLIKQHFPTVHDEADKIAEDARLVAPVDLVLAAFRVIKFKQSFCSSKTPSSDDIATEISRPTPEFVQKLDDNAPIYGEFRRMLNAAAGLSELHDMVRKLKGLLRYLPPANALAIDSLLETPAANPLGLPSMLMAHLPAPLVDVLLLFTFLKQGSEWELDERTALIAFVLYWLIFCGDGAKGATAVYYFLHNVAKPASESSRFRFSTKIASSLIGCIEAEGAATLAPRRADRTAAAEAVRNYDSALRDENSRYVLEPANRKQEPGIQALRIVTLNQQRLRRVLMWVQRHYLAAFPDYDPTSVHDDDLPFDLDHLIPQKLFGANSQTFGLLGSDLNSKESDLLRHRRKFGNSLGNYRWLAFSDNRARGAGEIEDVAVEVSDASIIESKSTDAFENAGAFNTLIRAYAGKWNRNHLADFQKVIDNRALCLIGHLLDDSTLADLLENVAVLPAQA